MPAFGTEGALLIITSKQISRCTLILAVLSLVWASAASAQPPTAHRTPPVTRSPFSLQVNSNIVLTSVVVRDKKTGEPVQGLTARDFVIRENGKPQQIISFDFENVDHATPLEEATVEGQLPGGILHSANQAATATQLRNHRLIILFFDLTSMQPDDLARAQKAARNYIENQMKPADLVSVISLSTSLSLDQDFTADKQLLLEAVQSYSGTEEGGFSPGATSTTNQVEDTTSFTPDESEFNDVNTDRELFALAQIASSLSWINQKKSLLYFSGGIQRDGIENQASLRAAVNAAVRANLAVYSVDTRGLQAISPLGDASTGSLRGNAAYTGAALQNNFDSNFNSQEVMATLSDNTGGKAFFDTNDFAPAFTRMQDDTSSYYILGYHSTDTKQDGSYRRLTVSVDRPGVELIYRRGYYAPADFKHATHQEREQQLEQELESDLPATDLEVYLAAYYFRLASDRFSVPVSLIVPGSEIPFHQGGDRSKATLDIIGQVKGANGQDVADVRQTVKLNVSPSQQVAQKNVQYSTSFDLPRGKYHLKFVVRENETGRMGSFETEINLPDLAKYPVKLSSVVLASQRIPEKKDTTNPLWNDGYLLVPNVAHVFHSSQPLYLLYEVYNPTALASTSRDHDRPIRLLTSIEFLRETQAGAVKVFETPLVDAGKINVPGRDAVSFAFNVPLTAFQPGAYICQVNVIDDAGGAFSFPRQALLIRPPSNSAPEQSTISPGRPGNPAVPH